VVPEVLVVLEVVPAEEVVLAVDLEEWVAAAALVVGQEQLVVVAVPVEPVVEVAAVGGVAD